MKILKVLFGIIALTAMLSSCTEEDRAREKENIEMKLPDGCRFEYLGWYGQMRVATVICKSKPVTNTITHWESGSGKNSTQHYDLIAMIEE